MDIKREMVKIENVMGRTTAQAMIEGEISPPSTRPDIGRVLSVEGKVNMGHMEVLENKVMMDGSVAFQVVYVSKDDEIVGFESVSGFKHSVEMEGIAPGMRGCITPKLSHVEYLFAEGRRIQVGAVVDMDIQIEQTQELELLSEINGVQGVQVLPKSIQVPSIQERRNASLMLRENIQLPQGLPAIKQVLETQGYVKVRDIHQEAGKVSVEGDLKITVTYLSLDDATPMAQSCHVLPFEQIIPVDENEVDFTPYVSGSVQEIYAQGIEDEEGLINIEAIVELEVECWKVRMVDIIGDAYSPDMLMKPQTMPVQMRQCVTQQNDKFAMRESIALPDGMPQIGRVLCVMARPVLTNTLPTINKVQLEGMLMCEVIYMSRENGVQSFVSEVAITQDVDLPNLSEGMEAEVRLDLEQVVASGGGDEVELKISFDCLAKGYAVCNQEMITGMAVEERTEALPGGILIYFADRRETLWSVAKKYAMTMDSILRYNPNVQGHEVKPGEKLLLYRIGM